MRRKLGLSRALKMEWLSKTADLVLEEKTNSQIRDELNHYLAFEIKSADNLRKTRQILWTVWVDVPKRAEGLKQLCLTQYDDPKGNSLAAHWCMLLLAYPLFVDTALLIGKIATIQDTFTNAWLKQRLFELWGERTSVEHSVKRILQTLVSFRAVERVKQGVYTCDRLEIKNPETLKMLLLTILALNEKAYYEIPELSRIPQLFPFRFEIPHEMIYNGEGFKLDTVGGKVVLVGD